MKNPLRLMRVAVVVAAFVLIAAACGGSSNNQEQAPLGADTGMPSSLPPNDKPDDAPAVAGMCAAGEPDCIDTVVAGGVEPEPLPVCAPDHPDCTDTVVAGGEEPGVPTVEPIPPAQDAGAGTGRTGIEALQIDGVWVFQHSPDSTMDALHSGTPEVVNGCLFVDHTIVVWHADRIDEAAEAVAAAGAGESPQLLIGGGGISLDKPCNGCHPQRNSPKCCNDPLSRQPIWAGGAEGIQPERS